MLDLEIGGGMGSEVQPIEVVDTGMLEGYRPDRSIKPLLRPPSPDSFTLRRDPRHIGWRPIPDELRVGRGAGFVELHHYYRPPGRPRHQQPWLATVWRKTEAG